MTTGAKELAASVLLICAAFGGVFFVSRYVEKNRISLPASYDDDDLEFQGKRLKGYALGSEGLIADWYWMNGLQYIGRKIVKTDVANLNLENLNSVNPRLLYPYLDNATDLDPKFLTAYSYGSIILPAIDPEKAIALTKKGIENNPSEWRFYQYLGYIYWKLGRYEEASETYVKGMQIPGAPEFMTLMAGAMKNQAGGRETARAIFQQMLDEAKTSETKYYAQVRLDQLHAFDEIDNVNSALKTFQEKHGRCVNNLSEIFSSLRPVRLPSGRDFRIDAAGNLVDPSDARYLLNRQICSIGLDPKSTKIPPAE